MEFIILLVFTTIIFLTLFVVLGQRMADINSDKEDNTVVSLRDMIVDEVDIAGTVENGYNRKFLVPKTIFGNSYNLSIDNQNELVIIYNDKPYVKYLPGYVMGGFCFNSSDSGAYYELAVSKFEDVVSLSSCFDCGWSYAVCANAEKFGLCSVQEALYPGFNETCCKGHCKCCPY